MTAATALPNAFTRASEHFPLFLSAGTQPVSSVFGHDVAPGASLQLKCCPDVGGVANAPPAVSRNAIETATVVRLFICPPSLGCGSRGRSARKSTWPVG